MSRLIFKDSYVIVEPSYRNTDFHKHSMLHIFLSCSPLSLLSGSESYTGSVIFLKDNVLHKSPDGTINYIFLIDPTSSIADDIRELIPAGRSGVSFQKDIAPFDFSEPHTDDKIALKLESFLSDMGIHFSGKKNMDKRIENLIFEIKTFKHLGKRVRDIAKEKQYSESWLTHLFKREAGISLKSYLLMRQLEYVWKSIYSGQSITAASLDSGFSSPSHFASVCKRMTGISVSNAL